MAEKNSTASEIVQVTTPVVGCDGGTLGHPMVYLKLDEERRAVCPYCSRQFVAAPGVDLHAHGH